MKKRRFIAGSFIYQYFQRKCPFYVSLFLQNVKKASVQDELERYFIDYGVSREEAYFHALKKEFGNRMVILEKDPTLSFEEELARRGEETEFWMKKGKTIICHGILQARDGIQQFQRQMENQYRLPFEICFRGEPDILFRRDGISSAFGNYIYEVGDLKSSYHSKFCQHMQVTYYSWLLEDCQKVLPPSGYLILQNRKEEYSLCSFPLEETIWTLRHFLEEEIWEWFWEKDNFYHIGSHCRGCPYAEHCSEKAISEGDLSLLPGLKRAQKKALWRYGFRNLEELAKAREEDFKVHAYPGVSAEQLYPFVIMSQSQIMQEVYYRPPKKNPQQVIEELTIYVELDQEYRAFRKHLHLHHQSEPLFLEICKDEYLGVSFITVLRENKITFYGTTKAKPSYLEIKNFWEDIKLILQVSGELTLIHYGQDLEEMLLPFAENRKDFSLFESLLTMGGLDLKKVIQKVLALPLPSYHLYRVIPFLEEAIIKEKKEEREHKKGSRFFENPPSLSDSFSFESKELLEIPSSIMMRIWLETEDPQWLEVLEWKMKENVKSLPFLLYVLQNLENLFPSLNHQA